MIHFQLLSSIDGDFSGTYTTLRPLLSIGKSTSCDLIARDPLLKPKHLLIQLEPDGILAKCFASKDSFHVNGKKVTGSVMLKKNDLIKLGNTELKLLNYEQPTKPIENLNTLRSKLQTVKNDYPLVSNILVELKKELLSLQVEDNQD